MNPSRLDLRQIGKIMGMPIYIDVASLRDDDSRAAKVSAITNLLSSLISYPQKDAKQPIFVIAPPDGYSLDRFLTSRKLEFSDIVWLQQPEQLLGVKNPTIIMVKEAMKNVTCLEIVYQLRSHMFTVIMEDAK